MYDGEGIEKGAELRQPLVSIDTVLQIPLL
jgi:hypothetical protein